MRRVREFLAGPGAVMLALAGAAVFALAGVQTQARIPLDGRVYPHPCTGEALRFKGDAQLTADVELRPLPGGGARVELTLDPAGSAAIGEASGRRFAGREATTKSYETPSLPDTTRVQMESLYADPSMADRFTALFTVDIRVDLGGRMTAGLVSVYLECRG